MRSLYGFNLVMGAGTGAVTAYLPLYAHEKGGLSVAAAGAVMIAAGAVAGVARLALTRASEIRWGFPDSMSAFALVAAVACVVLLLAPSLGPAAFWVGAALWGVGGLGFGAIAMLAVMSEAGEANVGRASGLTVLWFSLGYTVAPPLFGLSVDLSDAYAPAFLLITALYLVAIAIMVTTRSWYLPIAPYAAPAGEDPARGAPA
jgi:MFS family permease